ncbi:hypothetical protein L5515_018294 [Caenorhabditis briggsae]|uniref:HMG box domain-containing protein n=1 Tax=Caenorhabditis briggsae TaxID=6238 RepID=A0AAE9JS22_CAEBR|nr:hypothetical protein L5515_018294 [Caenorhabditis briggsae]
MLSSTYFIVQFVFSLISATVIITHSVMTEKAFNEKMINFRMIIRFVFVGFHVLFLSTHLFHVCYPAKRKRTSRNQFLIHLIQRLSLVLIQFLLVSSPMQLFLFCMLLIDFVVTSSYILDGNDGMRITPRIVDPEPRPMLIVIIKPNESFGNLPRFVAFLIHSTASDVPEKCMNNCPVLRNPGFEYQFAQLWIDKFLKLLNVCKFRTMINRKPREELQHFPRDNNTTTTNSGEDHMDSQQKPVASRVRLSQTSYPQRQMMPTLPLHLFPGMLPITQFNPFYTFSRLAPMIMPPHLPFYPATNMRMNPINFMAMQAMTPQSQLNAPFSGAVPTNIPMVPFPKAMQSKSSNQMNTIPWTVQKSPLNQKPKKENYIKKPLNAFMLFLKENRKTVLEENGNDQMTASALNKELGKRWHNLSDEERRKYSNLAKIEKQLHKENHPEWSERNNYTKKPKKRINEPTQYLVEMCRARFGIDNKSKWCIHCLRKKKCILSRVLSEIPPTNNEKTTSEIPLIGTRSSLSSGMMPIDLLLNQVALKLQSHAESLTNSEAREEGS